jgi:hypothetical protein
VEGSGRKEGREQAATQDEHEEDEEFGNDLLAIAHQCQLPSSSWY